MSLWAAPRDGSTLARLAMLRVADSIEVAFMSHSRKSARIKIPFGRTGSMAQWNAHGSRTLENPRTPFVSGLL